MATSTSRLYSIRNPICNRICLSKRCTGSTNDLNGYIITPGGPRPANRVHTVRTNNTVKRTDETNVFSVVQKPSPTKAQIKQLIATDLYTITPGGIRPKSMVHTVESGQVVSFSEGAYKRFDPQENKFFENKPADFEPQVFGSGWIVYASYIEPASNVIMSMTTTWVVPPAPARQDGQLIYLFNGLQDSPTSHILQPVLQWGVSPDGGGSKWEIASWFVDSSQNAFKTSLVQVNEGDKLVGVMRMTGKANNKFNYSCEFLGHAQTILNVQSANQLVNPVETLECYGISDCREYPNAYLTTMHSISVNTSNVSLPLLFGVANSITDCGQHADVVSNTASLGQVDLYYTTWFSAPLLSTVASINRMRDQLDLFVVGGGGGVYSTFWNPNGGWLNRWFRIVNDFTTSSQSVVSILSRYPDHLDLFAVGNDNAVYSTFWDTNGGWFDKWFRLADTSYADGFKVPTQSAVSNLSRYRDHIDLFVCGFDGGVYSTFWDVNGGWYNKWFRLIDSSFANNFTIPPGSPVSSLSRYKDHIDLFVCGFDGGVYSTFWDVNGGWYNKWFRLIDSSFADNFTIPPGSLISNLSRYSDHIDLFATGRDGGVYSTFWDINGGWYNKWFRLMDSSFADNFTIPPGSPVSSLSRYKDHIDLFVVGFDGGVYSTFWDINGGWYNKWFRLSDTNFSDGFTVPPGSRVWSLSRYSNHIDLFVTGRDGGIYSTFWDINGGWFNRWFRL